MLKLRKLAIEVQAAVVLMLIQLAHKFVAELPGTITPAGTTADEIYKTGMLRKRRISQDKNTIGMSP